MTEPTPVRCWTDPSCPWAWQAFGWLRDLREREVITLTHAFFSLEINARALERNDTDPGMPYDEAAPEYGEALTTLAHARRTGGQPAVEALLGAIGRRRHDERLAMSQALLAAAADEAGTALPDRDQIEPLQAEILAEYVAGKRLDVFGVPALQIADHDVIYGPIMAVGPTGDDGVALWREVSGVAARPGFFELKRWPRTQRPGGTEAGA